MKTIFKKIVTIMVMIGFVTSHMGCGSKAQKISTPLDQVKFEKNYKYTVKLKTDEQQSKTVSGDQIVGKTNQIIIQTGTTEKSIMSQDIYIIEGRGPKTGSYALEGLGIGAISLGGLGLIASLLVANNQCGGSDKCEGNATIPYFTALGIGLGGLFGFVIGLSTSKQDKIEITPIVTPTTSGVDTGLNLGFKF